MCGCLFYDTDKPVLNYRLYTAGSKNFMMRTHTHTSIIKFTEVDDTYIFKYYL